MIPLSEGGIKSENFTEKVCAYCGQPYRWYHSYNKITSDFNNKEFCSYTCRAKYYKVHEAERHQKSWEARFERIDELDAIKRKKDNERFKKKYKEDEVYRERVKAIGKRWLKK